MAYRSGYTAASRILLAMAAGWVTACAGQPSEPSTPSDPSATSSAAGSGEQSGASEAEGADDEADPAEGQYEVDTAPREVRYLVKPDGLQIDVAGARFHPKATAIRVGGGWGVRLEVEASSDDEKTHSLLAGDQGPLAFAGKVTRGGREKRFGEKRGGGEEQLLFPGAPLTLSRDWPGSIGQAPLRAGQQLWLEVGLWGLGDEAESRRPVKKFFLVIMKVGARKPDALIFPPEKL